MRTIPSVVTTPAVLSAGLLTGVWWSDGAFAALSLATGYVSAALLLATLLVTPIHRMRRKRSPPIHTPIRRSLGVHAGILAVIHVIVSFPVHLGGDVWRYFFGPDGGLLVTPFGRSNWFGLIATALIAVLALTSTDGWLRRLGSSRWKRLHQLVYLAGALSLAHTLGYQSIRDAWTGLTALVVAAAVGLVVARVVSSRYASASDRRYRLVRKRT
jgi:sulfoxide reductase heme-binding subunit YedZ